MSDLLSMKPKTKMEVMLLATLQEAEEHCESYQRQVITLQAQAISNKTYCNKLCLQLVFQEEKAANSGTPGKLVENGLPCLLLGDTFYKRAVEFTQWQKEKAQKADA
ncbi:hypothetical protein J3A83DRAFT_4086081 [Scleroderma citrinum]